MVRSRWSLLGFMGLSCLPTACADEAVPVASGIEPLVSMPENGATLTGPSTLAPLATFSRWLGETRATDISASLRVVRESTDGSLRFLRVEQQTADGLRVHGAYAKAAFDDRGALVHSIDALADVAVGVRARPASVDASAALAAALGHLGYDPAVFPAVVGRSGQTVRFAKEDPFWSGPEVELVAIPGADGMLRQGFVVQTWSLADNLLNHTLVDGEGIVLDVELRTAADSYRVFVEDPSKGGPIIADGPTSTTASPNGWLAGTQRDVAISGNNVKAYLDTDNNNAADVGGVTETDAVFDAAFDLTSDPSIGSNKPASVQNLFFLNNTVHDVLHDHGFNEAEGNFQADNFGRGGLGNDPVNAEAQDGGGLDNANFATPADGSAPRMQMYLWSPTGSTHEVVVGNSSFNARGAQFGTALTTAGVSGALALYNDGVGTGSDGCEAMTAGALNNKLAIIDRGTCDFVVKTTNAKNAGAKGVIIVNNEGTTETFLMGGSGRRLIPAVMVGKLDGATLKTLVGQNATERLKATTPPKMDGSLDADVVFHEFGHGLTWRMIGSMSGKLAGAIGEGASDGLAMILNGDDVIGEYSSGSATGIRRERYDTYSLSYNDVTGASVHNDGEIYGAIIWDLRKQFLAAGGTDGALLDLYVGGMRFTPATPDYEAMRDGLLQQGSATEDCMIWRAFAKYGVGVGADGRVTSRGVSITESFTVPATCTP